ncbi:Tat pathway signal protein [Ancylobacter sp. IITR112]|uniref:Acg family FMN-binding oxidoreductase n=1 Tax=Ancylobacter sp. IITR112 TaxID=3138073 RepID=UPI003529F13A
MDRRRLLQAGGVAVAAAVAGGLGWRGAIGSAGAYERYSADLRAPLPADPALTDLLRLATLAMSGHNTQPWRFRLGPGSLDLLPDASRATPVVDPDDHHLFVSLGCAAETLALAAAATGRPGEWRAQEEGSLRYRFAPAPPQADPLAAAITRRQSTRAVYDGRPVPAGVLAALARAAAQEGVRYVLLTERARLNALRDLTLAGNEAQMKDAAFRAELKRWLRFNPASAQRQGDGLYAGASGNPSLPDWAGAIAFDLFVTAAAENDKYARQIASSPGVAVFFAEQADPAHWIAVGRACQRFALAATAQGLKLACLNPAVEVPALRPELASLAGETGLRPDMVLRFGYGPTLPYAPRRRVAAMVLA